MAISERNTGLFFRAYIQAALWSSTDADGEPLDDSFEPDDIDAHCLEAMRKECQDFLEQADELIFKEPSGGWIQAGHDFWLTRCGHGAGFWDGDWPAYGDELTAMSKPYGNIDLYVGDDNKIYAAGYEQ